MNKLDVDKLKEEFIGTNINWFTITNIYRDDLTNIVMVELVCRCGNRRVYSKKRVFGKGFITSCGCHHNTEEYKQAHRMSDALKKHLSDKKKQFYLDHPEAAQQHSDRMRRLFEEEPERRSIVGNRISDWFKSDKDGVQAWVDSRKRWFDENQDLVKEASDKRVQYLKDHPEIELSRRDNISKWAKENPDKIADIANQNKKTALKKRANADYSVLFDIIEPSYIDRLKSGNIKAGDLVETKCPCCGKYAPHTINQIFVISRADFKGVSGAPLCRECHVKLTSNLTSKYEEEIANIVSIFYNGACIRNNRSVLNGKELDLYYPEKKIAIEFNGAYWHSTEIKPDGYHYNKYIMCKQCGILLVSIFENVWLSHKIEIVDYLHDLFDGRDNVLSFTKEGYMDNNFPSPNAKVDTSHIDDIIFYENLTIQTCGYSMIED